MKIKISTSNNITTDYITEEIEFYDIEALTNRYNYSFGLFKNGYRTIDNTYELSNILCYDIDENLTIKECKSLMENWSYIIATTKSHQKDKHGLVCDRFRLILPLTEAPEIHDYSKFYDYIGQMLGLKHDKATKDVSRFYFPNKNQITYINRNKRNNPLDTVLLRKLFIEDQSRKILEAETKRNEVKITVEGNVDALIHWFKNEIHNGSRNNLLYRLRKALENESIEDKTIIKLVEKVNYSLDNPLSEKELQKTVLRGINYE